MTDRSTVDLERFLRETVHVRNDSGGRGYDRGVRTFDCPLCGDEGNRGWMNVAHWTAGCFNSGCVAEPRLAAGAVEWARAVLGHPSRAEAWRTLAQKYGGASVVYASEPQRGPDFCTLPKEMRRFEVSPSPVQSAFTFFVKAQWGLSESDARDWGLGWCLTGDYAFRVVVPILMGGRAVGFQARSIRPVEPKYLTSRWTASDRGPAECARPAAAMLFNVDAVPREGEVLLTEGVGDVMGWHRGSARGRTPTAVGILGVALTPEKLALLASLGLERALVGLDDEPDAQRRALAHVEDLRAWGIPAVRVRWSGGKDAGAGATPVEDPDEGGLGAAVRSRLA